MIVFDLICSDGHRFESWFRSGAAYEAQAEQNAIACPVCGDSTVAKAPMRPFVARRAGERAEAPDRQSPPPPPSAPSSPALPSAPPAALAPAPPAAPGAEEALRAMRTLIEATCDDVGPEFPEQARRIHYGETDRRNIYGEASADEASALREEGIAIQPLPWMRRRHD